MIEKINLKDTRPTIESLFLDKPDLWTPSYGIYDKGRQHQRIEHFTEKLKNGPLVDIEIDSDVETSVSFIDRTFGNYDGSVSFVTPGSFGFIVPTRIKRLESGQSDDYSPEIDTLLPIFKHADAATKQIIMSGMCPFVIDRYRTGSDGRAGAMIFAPLLSDMRTDIGDLSELVRLTHTIINDTVGFAQEKLGITTVGLGAILPRVTNFGRMVENHDVTVTTGHAATVWMIQETVKRAFEKKWTRDGKLDRIGIIGTGAIGASVAALLLEEGIVTALNLTDIDETRGLRLIEELTRKYPRADLKFSSDNTSAINGCNVTISAAATKFDLTDQKWEKADFNDLWIIDDSQPGAFPPMQVREKGAEVEWPIGQDNTKDQIGTLTNFNYGAGQVSGPASQSDVFGCQGEVMGIYVTGENEKAVRREVQPSDAIEIGKLLGKAGIGLARPQSMGQYLQIR